MAYEYFSRKEWGARPARSSRSRNTKLDAHVVHHTADRNTPNYGDLVETTRKPGIRWYLSPKRWKANSAIARVIRAYERGHADLVEYEKRAMRAIQNYHMDVNRWADIGYHDVIFPSGHVYEGRAYWTQGAHALNGNHMYGVSFAGNYEVETLTPQAQDAYSRLLKRRGLSRGGGRGHYKVPGNATACPGRNIKSRLGV